MGKYIKLFNTRALYESFVESDDYVEPHVSLCEDDNIVNYNIQPNYNALKFSSPNACTLGINNIGSRKAQYSTDAKTWIDWDGTAVSFGNGTDLYVRGNNPNGWGTSSSDRANFTMTGSEVSCKGNIMHMLSYEEDLDTIPCNYCYGSMFRDCTSLVTAPELPATTLANYCYQYMFSGCTSLVNAPKLSATTLAQYCCRYMFNGCTSLVTAPKLPATTLAQYCYSGMFYGCSSLVNAPELPATTIADNCYSNMFQGCSSLVNAPKLPATTLANMCYSNMFQNCSSLVNAPELSATTLANSCYQYIFSGCSNLNHIKMMATSISASNCLNRWVSNISSTGTFECASGMSTVIPSGTSGIPTGWTVTEVAA